MLTTAEGTRVCPTFQWQDPWHVVRPVPGSPRRWRPCPGTSRTGCTVAVWFRSPIGHDPDRTPPDTLLDPDSPAVVLAEARGRARTLR